MTPEEMRTLYDYNAWANHRSLDAAANLTSEQFTKPMGSSFWSVRDTLAHICGAEWIWLERFQGRSPASLAGYFGVRGCGQFAREVGGAGSAAACVCRQADAGRFEPRDGIQDVEIWRVQKSAVAIDAACGESWDVPSRADYDAAAAAWCAADFDGLDALLSRTRDGG